jgi:hypothetical protein
MADFLLFFVELMLETIFSVRAEPRGDIIAETIGCLGGSVLNAMMHGRLNLENHDWRAICFGVVVLIAALVLGGLLLVLVIRLMTRG